MLPLLRFFTAEALKGASDRIRVDAAHDDLSSISRLCARCTCLVLLDEMEEAIGVDSGLMVNCAELTPARFCDLYLGILRGKQLTEAWAHIDLAELSEAVIEWAGWVTLSPVSEVESALAAAAAAHARV